MADIAQTALTNGWTLETDRETGDVRGIHEQRGLRTRWKRSNKERSAEAWVKHDIAISRIATRMANGQWDDSKIERMDRRRT